ncbi:hypothetical protein CMI37_31190 [Candidatus Pacearchaeota archaeon]|nr:hypothetical protein [Candidatus Pacearchaeota archaeon]|tara:strand:+ start:183 stop:557 length:375 start_codon:yes stop_codon:yes gene_type:complete
MSDEQKRFIVRLNAGSVRGRPVKSNEWDFATKTEAMTFADTLSHMGQAQIDRALITPQEIASIRKKMGMTQRDFAKRLGVKNHSSIHEWESGRFLPRLDMQRRLIRLLADDREEVVAPPEEVTA